MIFFLNGNKKSSFLNRREDVTEGDPLVMIAYGISILPLIKNFKQKIPDVKHTCYADNNKALDTFARIETYFNLLIRQGLGHWYYSKLSKIVLILHPENIEARKVFGACHKFKVCTGTRYLGGYIGDNNYMSDWMRKRTLTWEKNNGMISKTAENIPRIFTPQWHVQSNQSGCFCNTSHGTWGMQSREWRRCFKKRFFLVFYLERQK